MEKSESSHPLTASGDDPTIKGARLFNAVERILDDTDHLIAEVESRKDASRARGAPNEGRLREKVAAQLITEYSNRTAFTGGLTALPGIVPGWGTGLALLGGSLVDIAFMLKHEVELALCLTHLYGHGIREPKERWLAYVLVGVRTYEAKVGRNYYADLVEAELEALPRYTPRQLSKLGLMILGRLAVASLSRGGIARALPLVGVFVSAAANKVATSTVGWWCVDALEQRRSSPEQEAEPTVDADVATPSSQDP